MEKDFYKTICQTIDERSSDLHEISKKIWENPELGYEEYAAHELLTSFLEKEGFSVLKKTPLETSFIARYGNPGGLKIGVLCEYDALPGIGHACGHNLIAEAGIGAALGIKAALMKFQSNHTTELVVIGTPAEEKGDGKVRLIQKGVFDEIDFCLMSHPSPFEIPSPTCLAATALKVIFKGVPSHAGGAPWKGINALDAAVSCYTAVAMLRQQTKPTSRIHCIFMKGGEAINIIPDSAEIFFGMRSLIDSDLLETKKKIKECAVGAAEATGCSVEFDEKVYFMSSLKTNKALIQRYIEHAERLGVKFEDQTADFAVSTDMGNVSQIKPSIHPFFKINCNAPNHTEGFTEACGWNENQTATLNSAKSMAMTVIDVVCKSDLLKDVRENFK